MKNLKIAFVLFLIFIGSSCEKDDIKKQVFAFSKIKPSSHLAYDGGFELNTKNEEYINTIEWTKYESNYKSFEINIGDLNPGYYYYSIKDVNGLFYHDSIFLASCDTIEPLEYFPAYPGSSWIYSNEDTIWCSNQYNKVPSYSNSLVYPGTRMVPNDSIYVVKAYGVSCFDGNSSWVPYKKNDVGIFGYMYLYTLNELMLTQEQFFCEVQNCTFSVSGYRPDVYGWTMCEKVVNDTTVTINSNIYPNTQVIRKVVLNGTYGYSNVYQYYFAKDIGIVKCERAVDYANGIYETEYEIETYTINKP